MIWILTDGENFSFEARTWDFTEAGGFWYKLPDDLPDWIKILERSAANGWLVIPFTPLGRRLI